MLKANRGSFQISSVTAVGNPGDGGGQTACKDETPAVRQAACMGLCRGSNTRALRWVPR